MVVYVSLHLYVNWFSYVVFLCGFNYIYANCYLIYLCMYLFAKWCIRLHVCATVTAMARQAAGRSRPVVCSRPAMLRTERIPGRIPPETVDLVPYIYRGWWKSSLATSRPIYQIYGGSCTYSPQPLLAYHIISWLVMPGCTCVIIWQESASLWGPTQTKPTTSICPWRALLSVCLCLSMSVFWCFLLFHFQTLLPHLWWLDTGGVLQSDWVLLSISCCGSNPTGLLPNPTGLDSPNHAFKMFLNAIRWD